jgi:hypothetical protein
MSLGALIISADAGCQGIEKRDKMHGQGIGFRLAMRPGKRRVLPLTSEGRLDGLVETRKARIHAKEEYPFLVIFAKPSGGRGSRSAFRRPGCGARSRTAAK